MEEIIIDIENLKKYINNIQNEDNITTYKLGYRLGIIITQLEQIQDEVEFVKINMNNG